MELKRYYETTREFITYNPFFYDDIGIFWIWDKTLTKWKKADDIDLFNILENHYNLNGQTVPGNIRAKYLESMKRIGRESKPQHNNSRSIQFKNQIINVYNKTIIQATHQEMVYNPIPWKLGEVSETPTIDKLFTEWVGADKKQQLYELIAYCCYPDYPIHLIFCLVGNGANGKTSFQRLLTKFLGNDNCTSTELDTLMDSRFESTKLYKKLVCLMGETNFNAISRTSFIKKLSGQDTISFEMKGKQAFDGLNYAKIIIASNNLPVSTDVSDGFYRRWMVIDFDQQFDGCDGDIIESIPECEWSSLARKCVELLPGILERNAIFGQGNLEERRQKYILASNPLSLFLEKFYEESPDGYIRYSEMYASYNRFRTSLKKRTVSPKEFSTRLSELGIEVQKTSKAVGGDWENTNWVLGFNMLDVLDVTLRYTSVKNTQKNIVRVGKYVTTSTTDTSSTNNINDIYNIEKTGTCCICGKKTISENIDLCQECGK
jgi:putative DNA primase/helicase